MTVIRDGDARVREKVRVGRKYELEANASHHCQEGAKL